MSEDTCDICGYKHSKEEIKIGKKLETDFDDCGCKIVKLVTRLKRQIKNLKEEVSNLNTLLTDAQECDWDVDSMYKDFRDGTWQGNNLGGVSDKKMASWFAKRHNLNEKELED